MDLTSIEVVLPDHDSPDPYNRQELARRTVTLCPTEEFTKDGQELWRMPAPKKPD